MQTYKVDYLITGLDYGGAELQVIELLIRLKTRGWNVRLISMRNPVKVDLVEKLETHGIPVLSLKIEKNSYLSVIQGFFLLIKLLKQHSPHILHSHMVHANILARLVKKFAKVKVLISSAHSNYEGGKLRDLSYRYTDFLADLITNVSYGAVKRYIDDGLVSPKKIACVYNGINLSRFEPNVFNSNQCNAKKKFNWIAVGRLEQQKDYLTLLSAIALLENENVFLQIVGAGSLRDELHSFVLEGNLQDKVKFLGLRKDIPQLLHHSDAFVISSCEEGFGLVVAEAMACGLPVVVTDSGGPKEIVGEDASCGLVVPPKSPEALAQAMKKIMHLSEDERKQMGINGQKRVAQLFDIEKIVTQWEEIYQRLLK